MIVRKTPRSVPAPTPNAKVVFVDDEPSIVKTWGLILKSSGYDVICCGDAASALRAIAAGCDLVITDYHMPGMNGVELIRAGRARCDAGFVLLTANATPEVATAALSAGALCVVHKPVGPAQLLQQVAILCAGLIREKRKGPPKRAG